MNLVVVRKYEEGHTSGILIGGGLRLMTMERPWISNPAGKGGVRRESCIPEGSYALHAYSSAAKPDCYEMVNPDLGVYAQPEHIPAGQQWGRSNCLIHAGNFVTDVIGCIAVGLSAGELSGKPAVMASVAAMVKLREVLGRALVHTLQITSSNGDFK